MFNQLDKLFHRWDLVKHFVLSDIKVTYKNKVLGLFWTLLDPLLMMVVYIVLIVVIFKRGEPLFPALLLTGLISWRWFTTAITKSVGSITSKGSLLQTVKFPSIILPTQHILVGLIDFFFGLIVLIPLLLVLKVTLTTNLLWLPIVALVQLIFTLGLGYIVATLGVYFRDVANISVFGLKIWFYLSPVLYSVETLIPAQYQTVYFLANPMAILLSSYKNVVIRGTGPNELLFYTLLWGILLLICGLAFFNKKENDFTKVL